jgi:uncharacterized membrane protein YphA (DoxX/SURF4 family)
MSALRRFLGHPLVLRGSQLAVGIVFVAAALAKIGDPGYFAGQVHNYRLVPIVTENLVAMMLPWVELVAGVALVLGLRARAAALICTVLMALFTVGVALAVARGLDFECGCFGKADATRIGYRKLFENVVLTAVAAIAAGNRKLPG